LTPGPAFGEVANTSDEREGRAMTITRDEAAVPTAEAPAPPDPSHILQVGMGFWASKTLLSRSSSGCSRSSATAR
jgi:hypothetical protein